MKPSNSILLFSTLTLLAACNQTASPVESIREEIPLSPDHTILLEIESGDVTLVGWEAEALQIEGELLDSERLNYSISASAEQVVVTVKTNRRPLGGFSSPPAVLKVQMPNDITVRVQTFDAAVTVRGLRGDLQVSSVAGDILAEEVYGTVTLASGRGDITVRQSSGQLRILGEHGTLTLQDISGTLGSSTIMGTIRYLGGPVSGDSIHLEVDHGPVEIILLTDPNLEVEIRSTSGDVTCLAPGLNIAGRTCTGTLGAGGASLSVRTVSGSISLRLSPLVP